jgi:3-methyladenine DNA glycosylase/8-oxoguanine DNA glycosylase
MSSLTLSHKDTVLLTPLAPYNFDATVHKPSYFPSSDNFWEKDNYWITMLWKGLGLGLKLENSGTIDKPGVKVSIYSQKPLSKDYLDGLIPEIRWRFNLDSDISGFCEKYKNDGSLGSVIKKWQGMKPRAANSLYETLIIYIVLQNAIVRRSVQMLENLFNKYGKKIEYDGRVLSTFWEPDKIAGSSEQALRDLKIGYRAKYIMKISEQFARSEINEFSLRKMGREEVRREMLKLYGIGPASVDYLLFEYFYFYGKLETLPPWEQKIISKLIFDKELVSTEEILGFFGRFKGWEKLAFNYLWEDVFWRRKHEHIAWLEKEIRL